VVFEDAYDTTFDRMSVLLLHVISSRVINMPYRVKGFRSGKAWRRFFEEHGLKVISCVRYPGVQPLWLFLRHYLFVLEPS
jgi:hypothetical protein